MKIEKLKRILGMDKANEEIISDPSKPIVYLSGYSPKGKIISFNDKPIKIEMDIERCPNLFYIGDYEKIKNLIAPVDGESQESYESRMVDYLINKIYGVLLKTPDDRPNSISPITDNGLLKKYNKESFYLTNEKCERICQESGFINDFIHDESSAGNIFHADDYFVNVECCYTYNKSQDWFVIRIDLVQASQLEYGKFIVDGLIKNYDSYKSIENQSTEIMTPLIPFRILNNQRTPLCYIK